MLESSISSPLLLVCLLTWRCCHGVKAGSYDTGVVIGSAGGRCSSQYVTVADTTSFPVAGCYRKTTSHDHGSGFSYTNYKGKVVVGMASQPMVMWNLHDGELPWSIGENGEPPSAMCTSRAGTGTGMEGWECNDGATFEELVTCGCSASEEQASERYHAAWVDAQAGSINKWGGVIWGRGTSSGSSSSSSSSRDRRNNMRGGDSRDKRAPLVAGAGASGGAGVSRVLDAVGGDFHGFWMWVIIAGGIAGLIVLCCIGWYIRNPFFCQKAPPADPDAQAEDAAPQAPKTAFQPWGASAPPK